VGLRTDILNVETIHQGDRRIVAKSWRSKDTSFVSCNGSVGAERESVGQNCLPLASRLKKPRPSVLSEIAARRIRRTEGAAQIGSRFFPFLSGQNDSYFRQPICEALVKGRQDRFRRT
jgi:hypothetical protein